GRHAISGEWGHTPLPWPEADELPGPSCFCGQRGCNETWLSGPALTRQYDGETAPEEIAAQAARGEVRAEACLQRYENRLARGLASVINVIDPDIVVLGGGVSNLDRLYRNLPALLPPFVFSDRAETPVKPPVHGDSSGVRGAAWLWQEDEIAEGLPR
ncbi:MAG: ROK family protein, partial [Rhodovibrionaceae bacterium]